MKKRKSLVVLTVAAACSLLLFVACKPHHPKGAFFLDYLSESLDLSENQQSTLENIRVELTEKIEELHSNKKEMHSTLKNEISSDVIDKVVVKQLIADHREGMDEVIDLAIEKLAEFHATLSIDQREKLLKKLEKFEKYHHGRFHN